MNILLILPISFLLNIFVGKIKKIKFDPFIFIQRLNFISGDLYNRKIEKKSIILEFIIGTFSSIIIIVLSFIIPFFIFMLLYKINFILGLIIELALSCIIIGIRKPLEISSRIFHSLEDSDIKKAKQLLDDTAWIDTEDLEKDQIVKNTIEYTAISIAEDYVYPAIFLALGGAPLCFAYKVLYTLSANSSDTAYIDEDRSRNYLGIFNVKLCYLLNIIPSIFFSLSCTLASRFYKYQYKNSLRTLKRDGKNNKARLEASIAGALDMELGGEYIKDGEIFDRPIVGETFDEAEIEHLKNANKLVLTSSLFALGILLIIKAIILFIHLITFN